MNENDVIIDVKDLHKSYGQTEVIKGVDMTVRKGEVICIIGPSGAGKSTMLNAVAGVWPVDDGRIILDGVDVTAMPEYRRAQYIGRVFQDPMMGTAANMQIEENLALAARRGKKRTLRWGVTKAEREEYHEKLKSFGLGLEDRMTAKVGLLSGGQRQALTLLMASLQKPNLLLLDGRIERNHVGRDSFAVYMMLDGRMTLSWDKGTETVDRGETVLLPACIEEIGLEGRGKLLEIYID